jgi:hypothetical protein
MAEETFERINPLWEKMQKPEKKVETPKPKDKK